MLRPSGFKSTLMLLVTGAINEKGWKQQRAADELNTNQSTICDIKNDKDPHCSITRLVSMLYKMGYKVEIKLTKI